MGGGLVIGLPVCANSTNHTHSWENVSTFLPDELPHIHIHVQSSQQGAGITTAKKLNDPNHWGTRLYLKVDKLTYHKLPIM